MFGNECYSFAQLTIPSTTVSFSPTRNISNPKSTFNPDTYNGIYFLNPSLTNIDNGGVHINSTILSYAFYLLAEGGQGINDLGNSYCVHGIGKQKAWKIAYHALENYLTTYSTFNDTRNAFVQSAMDLFGNGLESAECQAAWYAVGVGGPPSVPFIPISNKTESGSANYHYNNSISIFNYTTLPNAIVDISSKESINVLSETRFSQNSEVHLYIAPACVGGAKYVNNTPSNNPHHTRIVRNR